MPLPPRRRHSYHRAYLLDCFAKLGTTGCRVLRAPYPYPASRDRAKESDAHQVLRSGRGTARFERVIPLTASPLRCLSLKKGIKKPQRTLEFFA